MILETTYMMPTKVLIPVYMSLLRPNSFFPYFLSPRFPPSSVPVSINPSSPRQSRWVRLSLNPSYPLSACPHLQGLQLRQRLSPHRDPEKDDKTKQSVEVTTSKQSSDDEINSIISQEFSYSSIEQDSSEEEISCYSSSG